MLQQCCYIKHYIKLTKICFIPFEFGDFSLESNFVFLLKPKRHLSLHASLHLGHVVGIK